MGLALTAAALTGLALALCWAPVRSLRDPPAARRSSEEGGFRRHRLLLAVLAACGGVSFVGGGWGWAVGLVLSVGVLGVAARIEPPAARREREELRRDLPHVVQLLGISLAAGAPVPSALHQVSLALPGPASESLRLARSRLALGVPPAVVWSELAAQAGLEPLGGALARADRSGVRVADAVRRLGDELARERRLEIEDRARAVGIRAALPLGVCLLPAFLVVGIVPVIATALANLQW